MIIAGPSQCGKTTFVKKLLNSKLINLKNYKKIIWCYGTNVFDLPSELKKLNIKCYRGIPDPFPVDVGDSALIILDDLMTQASNEKISNLFTRGVHHDQHSVIHLTQNFFHQGGKFSRDISLNANYLVYFKNPRDQSQFQYLARQLYPENSKSLLQVYKEVTKEPHSYLFIDLSQSIPDHLRFRSDIFNTQAVPVYCSTNWQNEGQVETIEGAPVYPVLFK